MSEDFPLEVLVKNNENIEDKNSYLYELDPKDKKKEIVKYERIDGTGIFGTYINLSLHDIKLHESISYYPDSDAEEKLKKNKKKEKDFIEPISYSTSSISGTGRDSEGKTFSIFGSDYFHEEVKVRIHPAINHVPHAKISAIKPSSDGLVKEEVSMFFYIDTKKFEEISTRFLNKNISEMAVSFTINENCEGIYQPFSWLPHDDHRIKFLYSIDDVKNKSELPSNFKASMQPYTKAFDVSIISNYADNNENKDKDKDKEINDMIKKKEFYPEDIKAMIRKDKIRDSIIGIVFLLFITYLIFN